MDDEIAHRLRREMDAIHEERRKRRRRESDTRYVHSSPSATYGEEEDHRVDTDLDLDREPRGGSTVADVPRSDFPDDAGHRRTGYYNLPGWHGLDCLDVIAALNLNFALGSALKYLWRAGRKTPDRIQDLEKARDFIDREIRRLKGE
jgi:hypothetical protein